MIRLNSVSVLALFLLVLFCYEAFGKNYAPNQEKAIQYKVSVRTGDVKGAWTDSFVAIELRGENGNITKKLDRAKNHPIKFRRGTADWFYFHEKYIGKIESIKVKIYGGLLSKSWFLENIWVHNVTSEKINYYFGFNCWLNTKDQKTKELLPYQYLIPNPGLKGRVTEKAINYVFDNFLDYGMTVYNKVNVPDRYYDKIVAGVKLSNISIVNMTYPDVQMFKESGKLHVTVHIDEFNITANYKATYIKIPGSGRVKVNATNFDLHFDLLMGRNDDNMPYLSLPYCKGHADFHLKFHGGHDVTLNFFTKKIPAIVIDEAYKDICTTLSETIYDQVNELIKSQVKSKLSFAGICVDMSLLHKPNIMSDALEISIRGEFSSTCDDNDSVDEEFITEVPIAYADDSKMVYAYVTEFSINSFLSSAYETGRLTFNLTKDLIPEEFQQYLNSAKVMIPELKGTQTEPVVFLKPIERPQIQFQDGKLFIKVSIDVNIFFDGENKSHHISDLQLVTNLNCDVKYSNSKLNFLIHEIDSSIVMKYMSYEPFGDFLTSAFQPILQLIKSVANTRGEQGIPLEIPEFSEVVQLQDVSAVITEHQKGHLKISTNFNLNLDNLNLNFDNVNIE